MYLWQLLQCFDNVMMCSVCWFVLFCFYFHVDTSECCVAIFTHELQTMLMSHIRTFVCSSPFLSYLTHVRSVLTNGNAWSGAKRGCFLSRANGRPDLWRALAVNWATCTILITRSCALYTARARNPVGWFIEKIGGAEHVWKRHVSGTQRPLYATFPEPLTTSDGYYRQVGIVLRFFFFF